MRTAGVIIVWPDHCVQQRGLNSDGMWEVFTHAADTGWTGIGDYRKQSRASTPSRTTHANRSVKIVAA